MGPLVMVSLAWGAESASFKLINYSGQLNNAINCDDKACCVECIVQEGVASKSESNLITLAQDLIATARFLSFNFVENNGEQN
jgi:hypothetical protein